MKHYGIPTRPRGSDVRQHFKTGHRLGVGRKNSPEMRARLRQIALADGRVPYDPAVGSYMKGRRGSNTPNWKGGVTAERQAFYSSPAWKTVAPLVWHRDDATCQRCQLHKSLAQHIAFDIHHIVPFTCVELRAALDNLVLLCEPCHYWVHSRRNMDGLFIGKVNRACA